MAEKMAGQSKASKKRNRKKKNKEPLQDSPTLENESRCVLSSEDTIDPRPSLEQELEWCINQIKLGLNRPKVSQSQRKEAESLSKKLSSSKTPLPRKRQLMHSNFGNYRQIMKEQPLAPVLLNIKPSLTAPGAVDKEKGQFYRISSKNVSDCSESFRFDFNVG